MRRKKDYLYDFLPSNIAIAERPPTPLAGAIIYSIAIFLIALLILSYVLHIDVVTSTTGIVEMEDGIQIVNTNESAKIKEIVKKEGDEVKAGDTILILENSYQFQLDKLKQQNAQNELQKKMLESEMKGIQDMSIFEGEDVDEDKRMEYQMEYQIYWTTKQQERESNQKRLSKLQEELENPELSEERRKDIVEQIEENKQSEANKQTQEQYNLKKSLNELSEQIKTTKNSIIELEKKIAESTLSAPVDGRIVKANYQTVGSYISPTEALAEILLASGTYIIKANIENKDVAKIKAGQEVYVKIDAYDYQIYGSLTGKVSEISETAKLNEAQNNLTYEVSIEIPEDTGSIALKPGMSVQMDIKTDEKRILDFILDPVKKTVDEAF